MSWTAWITMAVIWVFASAVASRLVGAGWAVQGSGPRAVAAVTALFFWGMVAAGVWVAAQGLLGGTLFAPWDWPPPIEP
jgi:hypothetical protein